MKDRSFQARNNAAYAEFYASAEWAALSERISVSIDLPSREERDGYTREAEDAADAKRAEIMARHGITNY